MSSGHSEEFFCYFPPVDPDNRYTYATLYARYPNQEKHIVAIGVIAISDRKKDHYILQFFNDNEIEKFFKVELIDNFDNFSEQWLAAMSCKEFKNNYFMGTPFVLEADSAEEICKLIHDQYEEDGYVVTDDHEKLF